MTTFERYSPFPTDRKGFTTPASQYGRAALHSYPDHESQSYSSPTLPWLQPMHPEDQHLQPWFVELNSFYSHLSVPESERTLVIDRYTRHKDLIQRAVDLRDGRRQPSPSGGFSPPPRADADPENSTVFIGGVTPQITSDLIRVLFLPFGEINYVKVPNNKNCAFVKYTDKQAAHLAIERMQGFSVEGTNLRTSWGKPSSNDRVTTSPVCTPDHFSRLCRYINPDEAQRILTAIDTIFDGNLETFKQGLLYLLPKSSHGSQSSQSRSIPHSPVQQQQQQQQLPPPQAPALSKHWQSHPGDSLANRDAQEKASGRLTLNATAIPFDSGRGYKDSSEQGHNWPDFASSHPARYPHHDTHEIFPNGFEELRLHDDSPLSRHESLSSSDEEHASSLYLSELSTSPPIAETSVSSSSNTSQNSAHKISKSNSHDYSTQDIHPSFWNEGPAYTRSMPTSAKFGPVGGPTSGPRTGYNGDLRSNAHQYQGHRQHHQSAPFPSTSAPTYTSELPGQYAARRRSNPVDEVFGQQGHNETNSRGFTSSSAGTTHSTVGPVRSMRHDSNEAIPGFLLNGSSVFGPLGR